MTTTFGRPSLTDQVVQHMTQMIADEVWHPGMLLPSEGALALELGVSRTVIRECVKVLASRGMVSVQQGRGTFVTSPADWTVIEPLALLVRADRTALLEWLEVRIILEMESAHLATLRANEPDYVALREALERIEQAGEDVNRYREADIHLHLTIARATHNTALVRLLYPVVQPLREQLQASAALVHARQAATHEHRTIIAGILAGDANAAREAMEAHLRRVDSEIPE